VRNVDPRAVAVCRYGTAKDQQRFAPLFVCLLDDIITSVYQRAARTGQSINPALLLVLDEAANLTPLPDLAQLAATGRGQGLQLITVLQDLQQAEQRWPRQAETILNNHRAKLLGTGLADTRTLQYTSRLLGDQPLSQTSTTRGEHGRNTTTHSQSWRALASANVLRESLGGTAVRVYGTLPPARLRLRPFYADPGLRRLASTSPAHNARPRRPTRRKARHDRGVRSGPRAPRSRGGASACCFPQREQRGSPAVGPARRLHTPARSMRKRQRRADYAPGCFARSRRWPPNLEKRCVPVGASVCVPGR
jgi:type IV secretory pathway TraG/TraD family ATPase VirD4